MHTIAQKGRWKIEVVYHEEATINTIWSDACTYYINGSTTGKTFDTYNWSQNDMLEQSGPVSVSFTEDGKAILLKYHNGSTSIKPLPDEE